MSSQKVLSDSFSAIYRPAIITILSFLVLYITSQIYSHQQILIETGIYVGAIQILVLYVAAWAAFRFLPATPFNFLKVVFGPKPGASVALLFSATLGLLIALQQVDPRLLDVYGLNTLVFSYLLGSGMVAVFLKLLPVFRNLAIETTFKIDRERYDAFTGALLGSIFLGTGFVQLPTLADAHGGLGPVLLPIYFGLAASGLTMLMAISIELYPSLKDRGQALLAFAASGVLLVVAAQTVDTFLPSVLIYEGKEYVTSYIFFAMQIGIVAALISGAATYVYKVAAQRYLAYLLEKSPKNIWANVSLRFFINVFMAIIPVATIASALVYTYQLTGVYALSLTFMCMVSNIGLNLTISKNYLNLEHLKGVSAKQKAMIHQISPTLNKVCMLAFRSLTQKLKPAR